MLAGRCEYNSSCSSSSDVQLPDVSSGTKHHYVMCRITDSESRNMETSWIENLAKLFPDSMQRYSKSYLN